MNGLLTVIAGWTIGGWIAHAVNAIPSKWLHRSNHANWKQQASFVLIEVGYLYDALVSILSLGFLHAEIGAWLLFDVFGDL